MTEAAGMRTLASPKNKTLPAHRGAACTAGFQGLPIPTLQLSGISMKQKKLQMSGATTVQREDTQRVAAKQPAVRRSWGSWIKPSLHSLVERMRVLLSGMLTNGIVAVVIQQFSRNDE